jgi:hypothetical protein
VLIALVSLGRLAAGVAMVIIALIPVWLDLMVYFMVLVTVVSGVDFVFDLRRRLGDAEGARAARNGAAESKA